MLTLSPVNFIAIQKWLVDFKQRARHFEVPPDTAEIIGIWVDGLLHGYFILQGYANGVLEINQGYLMPTARHKRLSYLAMKLLQEKAKKQGFTKIILKAGRSLRAYSQFMNELGYKPEAIIFSKEVN